MSKNSAMNYKDNLKPKETGIENECICQSHNLSEVNDSACMNEIFAEKEKSVFSITDVESFSRQRDLEFCELYFKVIDKQLARGDYEENIKQAKYQFQEIHSQTDKWCKFKKEIDSEQIIALKSSFYYRMLCIYSNATCISSAVAYHFESFLNQNSKIFKSLLNKNVLKICSVGGGLPADIIAFVKVLESSIYMKEDLQIHVTIIDVDKKWKKPCLAILQSLGNFNKEKWKIDFVSLDLASGSLSNKIETAIKEAHLVSFLKYLNLLQDKDSDFKRNLFQKLHHLVSEGSVLFLLDHADFEVMKVFGGYLGRLHGHKLLYDVVCHLHTLQQSTVERLYHLFSKHLLSSGMCNTSFKLFCRAWVRTNETFRHTGDHLKVIGSEQSLEEKKAMQGQLRLLCHKLRGNKISKDLPYWRDIFVSAMKNQGCSQKTTQRILETSEKDLVLRKVYAKQLMYASYDEFLEEAREITDSQKKTDEALKDEKRKDFQEKMKRAHFESKTYDASIKKILRCLSRSQSSKAT